MFDHYDLFQQQYDSVAFRQIDEDIRDFKFPAFYYEETIDQNQHNLNGDDLEHPKDRVNKLIYDKQQMRKLMRILLVWGKSFSIKGVKYQFTYSTGFLKVAHRFLNIMPSIEEAFWILVGIIKEYPRLWCLKESSLLDDARSNFRYEMTVMKAILNVNFPQVADKLYELGIPIESLVYDSMTSLYSDYFHSDILLRIWDQMIFNFNTSQKKRGIWMILAPAMLMIAMNSKKISNARTAKDVFTAYKDGSAVVFNPNKVIDMLNSIIDDIFVLENSQQHDIVPILNENGSTGGTFKVQNKIVQTGSTGYLNIFMQRGNNTKRVSQNPLLVDEARREIQKKLDVIN